MSKDIQVDLQYPRCDDRPDTIRVTLCDVRSADDLLIRYDFDRDGWVLYQESVKLDADGAILEDHGVVEVGFVKAWQNAEEIE